MLDSEYGLLFQLSVQLVSQVAHIVLIQVVLVRVRILEPSDILHLYGKIKGAAIIFLFELDVFSLAYLFVSLIFSALADDSLKILISESEESDLGVVVIQFDHKIFQVPVDAEAGFDAVVDQLRAQHHRCRLLDYLAFQILIMMAVEEERCLSNGERVGLQHGAGGGTAGVGLYLCAHLISHGRTSKYHRYYTNQSSNPLILTSSSSNACSSLSIHTLAPQHALARVPKLRQFGHLFDWTKCLY